MQIVLYSVKNLSAITITVVKNMRKCGITSWYTVQNVQIIEVDLTVTNCRIPPCQKVYLLENVGCRNYFVTSSTIAKMRQRQDTYSFSKISLKANDRILHNWTQWMSNWHNVTIVTTSNLYCSTHGEYCWKRKNRQRVFNYSFFEIMECIVLMLWETMKNKK